MNFRNRLRLFVFGLILFLCAPSGRAQSSGSIQGVVKDATGGVLTNATIEITDPATAYHRETTTGPAGDFRFTNIPFNPYHLSVSAKGFTNYTQDVDVRSSVPVSLDISLKLGVATENITVEATAGDLVETEPTYHTDVDRALFERLPLESASSSLSSLVTLSSPGVAADSNGLFHGLGDHASNSFSVDGQPITDQQSKVFSNQIPEDSIQSLEVISGAPPAEFGGKTSLVIVATTRSGLGETEPHGQVTTSFGSFGSSTGGFNLAFGSQKLGNFISANGLNTSRFLDPPEYGVQHDRGNEENIFDRVDFKPSSGDTVSLNFNYSRSWFQTPNSYDAEYGTFWTFNSAGPATCPVGQIGSCGGLGPNGLPVGPADQRSKIGTFNIAPSWTHLINTNTVFTLGGFVRRDQYNYYPSANPFADASPALQLTSVGQNRTLLNAGARTSLSYVKGINNIKAGVTFEHTFLTENDQYGIVDPTYNAVCLNPDGSPDTNPSITNPTQCTGALTPNTADNNAALGATVLPFTPLLGCYDLTRTAPLPVSDGCPAGLTTSGVYPYHGHTDIKETALYVQDSITVRNWSFNLGLRVDLYNGIASAKQAEPRVGVAYNIKPTNTVLRVSYARTMESPFNENLIVASTGCDDPVIFDLQQGVNGGQCVSSNVPPLSPGKRNEFHAGLEQAFGKYLVIDGEYIWKYTTRAFDFSVLDNTPVTYPIEWSSSKIPGYAIRVSVPRFHGLTAYTVMSSVAARFYGPQISGIGATPGVAGGVFRIDHDEKFNQTTHVQYQPWKKLPWVAMNWRYDSGLVAGALPYAGGETITNGPGGVNGLGAAGDIVDASNITPDQQFQAGLFCKLPGGTVYATPMVGLPLCPALDYGSKYLSIPAADTEDDDHNPPRVASRNLFDVSVGDDNIFNKDRYKWSLRLTAINVTNKVALYNFLSTFSGTHYVSPRALTAELGFHF
jgi:hypothetical protein